MSTQPKGGSGREVFHFLRARFDVTMAQARIAAKPREPEMITTQVVYPVMGVIRIKEEHVDQADVTKPLIFVPLIDGSILCIDGWHRVAKAKRLGLTELPGYVIEDPEELKAITLDDGGIVVW